jgi:predicted CXXCH cytochrome family protein
MSPRTRTVRNASAITGIALLALCALAACGGAEEVFVGTGTGFVPYEGTGPHAIHLQVLDSSETPVAGATVFLVPAADVDRTAFDGADVRAGASEDYDEPLEDAVRLRGGTYPRAQTDAGGNAWIAGVPDGPYFTLAIPALGDAEHLPGGTGGRQAREALTLSLAPQVLRVSSRPPPAATFVGSTTCLGCHAGYAAEKTHAHRVALHVPDGTNPRQDVSRYPDFDTGWNQFLLAPVHTGGTAVWCYDFDPGRDTDKFKTSLIDPALAVPPGVPFVKAWLWRDSGDMLFKITLENVHPAPGVPGPMDPPDPWTLVVDLTYGGAMYKQTPIVRIPGRKGHYPLLQFQHDGNDGRYDRTRKVYRDYGLGRFWDDALKIFRYPDPTATFEANCAGCHLTGFERFLDPAPGGAWLARAVEDPSGVIDLDGDGDLDEINIGCEKCHGPGSAHAAWAADPLNVGHEGRFVVSPAALSPSRALMLCGRCHDRVTGHGMFMTDQPLDVANQMPAPGLSRAEFLAAHALVKGPGTTDLWSDELHSRNQHQQYSDLLKSPKHRNERLLVVCLDCHDSHGAGAFDRHLRWDPDDSVQGLCFQCHGQVLTPHMLDETSATHAGGATRCIDCHMVQTARAGAGRYAHLLAVPTGTITDLMWTYYDNDLRSHLFRLPRKTHPDVKGVLPGLAMPIPYTGACGVGCHNVAPLQIPKPVLPFMVGPAPDETEEK